MPSRHPVTNRNQFIFEPFLSSLDDFLLWYPIDEEELNRWTSQRNSSGFPVAQGQIALVLSDMQFRHYSGTTWIKKFDRLIEDQDIGQGGIGATPPRYHDWETLPLAIQADQWATEISAGFLANHNWPFTSDTAPSLTFDVAGPHQNHMAAQIASNITLTFNSDVDMEVICIGAGGSGQNWFAAAYKDPSIHQLYWGFGGAGGGAGAVTLKVFRFLKGDQLTFQIGRSRASGNTYDLACTVLYKNGAPILFAPGGQPFLQGGTFRTRSDSVDPAGGQRVTGSGSRNRRIRNYKPNIKYHWRGISEPSEL